MNHPIRIAPSLLSANFARLEEEVRCCEHGGAEILHIDVMDGHFVPNITVGALVVEALRPITTLVLDCHLMITEPERYIEAFAEAGADWISVHVEATRHLHRTLSLIRACGSRVGVVLNPVTPLVSVFDAVEYCDFVLLMSVNPGFGGQAFIPSFFRRARELRAFLNRNRLEHIEIEVDGGVGLENAEEIVRAGASILVSGSGVFRGNPRETIPALRRAAERGLTLAL
ncbi:MAG: ribulose-phosphate 3-epimerase [Bacteroidota bacterium]|nr:ribulose-phosphate 3-epimerase [Candidatus Kapabacteria bacterium]MDW8219785.1 ribulose-phosphate 3-epimerase [Bacteroidota bacterium]